MFGKAFQHRYALTDQGVKNTRKGAFWTVIVNLVVMGGMGILYLMMSRYMETLTKGTPLPNTWTFLLLVAAFIVLSMVTHIQQYKATYGLVYGEVKATRLSLAERLRKLPLGYFGRRDLADLTETIMGDVNRLEHVWSHCLGYLYGSIISTVIVAIALENGLFLVTNFGWFAQQRTLVDFERNEVFLVEFRVVVVAELAPEQLQIRFTDN